MLSGWLEAALAAGESFEAFEMRVKTAADAARASPSFKAGATMNKAKIISELENMVVTRLFGRQPWLADPETCDAVRRKLMQMGLVEQVRVDPPTWQYTPLGKEHR